MESTQKLKNIAIIIPGGIGTGKNNHGVPILQDLVRRISSHHNVTVFSLFKVNANYHADGFQLISIPYPGYVLKAIVLFYHFIRSHKRSRFDVIHSFWTLPSGLFGVIIGRLFGIKTIVSVLGGDAVSVPEINYGEMRRAIPKQLVLWSLRKATEVHVLTKFICDSLTSHGLTRKMHIIPFGVDQNQFPYRGKEIGSVVDFLHVGSFSLVKDHEMLLRAFASIAKRVSARLLIVGEGSQENNILSLIESMSLQSSVRLQSAVAHDELPAIYKRCDILLHTSRSEGQAVVVNEAMSTGLLVCGTNVGLIYDLPTCCIGVPVGDHEKLAANVIDLLQNPEKMNLMRTRAIAWCNNFDIGYTVRSLSALYEN